MSRERERAVCGAARAVHMQRFRAAAPPRDLQRLYTWPARDGEERETAIFDSLSLSTGPRRSDNIAHFLTFCLSLFSSFPFRRCCCLATCPLGSSSISGGGCTRPPGPCMYLGTGHTHTLCAASTPRALTLRHEKIGREQRRVYIVIYR